LGAVGEKMAKGVFALGSLSYTTFYPYTLIFCPGRQEEAIESAERSSRE